MGFAHKTEAKDLKKMTESEINHFLAEYGEAEYQRGVKDTHKEMRNNAFAYQHGAISFMEYVDKHCHDKDNEICLDDDITILYENWKNEGN